MGVVVLSDRGYARSSQEEIEMRSIRDTPKDVAIKVEGVSDNASNLQVLTDPDGFLKRNGIYENSANSQRNLGVKTDQATPSGTMRSSSMSEASKRKKQYIVHKQKRKPKGRQTCLGNFIVDRPCTLILVIIVVISILVYAFAESDLFTVHYYHFSGGRQHFNEDHPRLLDYDRMLGAQKYIN